MTSTEQFASRNDSLGFAERTRKNLLFVENAFDEGHDVHVVMQIVNSTLGLVVFPWERTFRERADMISVSELDALGWPRWEGSDENCKTLGDLIFRLRNGIAHSRLSFSSERRNASEVVVEISNHQRKGSKDAHWVGKMTAADLKTFCLLFIEYVEATIN